MNDSCCGVILAGGLARRMGGQPKHQLMLEGRQLLDHVIERAQPQVGQLLLNFNPPLPDDIADKHKHLPIIEDSLPGHLGPLAGVLSALEWMHANSNAQWLASFAVDTPQFPRDLVTLLMQSVSSQGNSTEASPCQLVCASYQGYKQPTFCLWHRDQANSLRNWLTEEKNYRMGAWLKQQNAHLCDFPSSAGSARGLDPFTNINTPEQLVQLEHFLSSEQS